MSLDVDLRRSRAVLLGVSFFPRDPERLPPLPAVRTNLRDLERALADPTILGLDPRHIAVVDDRPASEMLSKLVEVADEAEDTLIVYYAGHGVPGSTNLYLTGTDSSERTIEFDGMPFDRLRRALNTSPARKKVLILDCCYSGRALDIMGSADAMLQAGIEDLEGTFTLASSGATEASAAPAGARCTAFTGELLRVLHEGIVDAPQTLKLNEIFRALRLALRRNPKFPEPRQAAKGTAGDIDFVHNRAWRPEAAAPEPTRGDATAAGATPDWQKELSARIEQQSRLIEALQKQLASREPATAEKIEEGRKAHELAEEQAALDHDFRGDPEAYRQMLKKQEMRIAELEASLARLHEPPTAAKSQHNAPHGAHGADIRSAFGAVVSQVNTLVGNAQAGLDRKLFGWASAPLERAKESLKQTSRRQKPASFDARDHAATMPAEPAPLPRRLGIGARIGIIVLALAYQLGLIAFATENLQSSVYYNGRYLGTAPDFEEMFVFACVTGALNLGVWLLVKRRYGKSNPAFSKLLLPVLVAGPALMIVAALGNM